VDRYTIERELGAGGMATVYLADDLKVGEHSPIGQRSGLMRGVNSRCRTFARSVLIPQMRDSVALVLSTPRRP
jgi:serine/threonine protein kinase